MRPISRVDVTSYEHLNGRVLEGHEVLITTATGILWADILQLPFDAVSPHPSLAYFVAMDGLNLSWNDIFGLMGAGPDDLPLYGECRLTLAGRMALETRYSVAGHIVRVERKSSNRMPVFDRLVFRVDVTAPGGALVATLESTVFFPRVPLLETAAPVASEDAGDVAFSRISDPARIRNMAALTRDPNLLHLVPDPATVEGASGAVVQQGTMVMAWLLEAAMSVHDPTPSAIAVRFLAPIHSGQVVECTVQPSRTGAAGAVARVRGIPVASAVYEGMPHD